MGKNIVLIGNGSIAEIVLKSFDNMPFSAVAIGKEHIQSGSNEFNGFPIVALEELAQSFDPSTHDVLCAVGYAGMNRIRADLSEYCISFGFTFCNLVHGKSSLHPGTIIGSNNVIFDNVSLQPGAKIGNGNFLWSNTVVAHGATLGDYNWVASGTVIGGNAKCGNRSFYGVNCSVSHNVTIADQSFIGAGVNCNKCTNVGDALILEQSYQKAAIDSVRFIDFMERTAR